MAENTAFDRTCSVRRRLREWFATAPGRSLMQSEQRAIAQILPNLFGYHLIQIGRPDDTDLLGSSRINHRAIIDIDPGAAAGGDCAAVCLAEAMPLAADSTDVLLLPHVLEFVSDPHQVLREIERVLIGEGHAVITIFNPWSLWGLWRLLLAWREEPPWCGHFLSLARLKDWLNLLGFEITLVECLFFRPPLRSERLLAQLAFLEKLGHWCWPMFGAVHVVVAKKRVIPLTPARELWRDRRRLIAAGAIQTTPPG